MYGAGSGFSFREQMALDANLCKFPLTSHPCVVLCWRVGSACLLCPFFTATGRFLEAFWEESFGCRLSPQNTRNAPPFPDFCSIVRAGFVLFCSVFFCFPRLCDHWEKTRGRVFCVCEQNAVVRWDVMQFPASAVGVGSFFTFCLPLRTRSALLHFYPLHHCVLLKRTIPRSQTRSVGSACVATRHAEPRAAGSAVPQLRARASLRRRGRRCPYSSGSCREALGLHLLVSPRCSGPVGLGR